MLTSADADDFSLSHACWRDFFFFDVRVTVPVAAWTTGRSLRWYNRIRNEPFPYGNQNDCLAASELFNSGGGPRI